MVDVTCEKLVDTTHPVNGLPLAPRQSSLLGFQIPIRFIEAYTILVEQRSIYIRLGHAKGGCKNGSMFAMLREISKFTR